jgi:hypothetical protein
MLPPNQGAALCLNPNRSQHLDRVFVSGTSLKSDDRLCFAPAPIPLALSAIN